MGWWVAGGDKCQSRATIYVNGPQAVPGSVTVTAILFTTGELTVVLCTTVTQCMVSVYSVPVTHLVDVVHPPLGLNWYYHFILFSFHHLFIKHLPLQNTTPPRHSPAIYH